ncbi:hypothetical protein CONCODRAFT_14125 [Conidiobolus coronatus NRRL 28638]|uniref:G-protein coupled receptors family 1 profile domain-containing protein n=1 Tax=Conidiobolus coronatus (strain ATCC 28846 / CBS 209.66 / NRRL 28638) TaxID=796925 RepID=A0A137NPL5_CONC2|nr:hypothetical protein CONCODRAFT_14125 [Conidiobolus coronatus NRRL 28638]|eukprot:KXN64679.1 hypothetical protein CONCODRAFT_14125 [Conidiobolus coronatus NRRL 28638]
MSLKDIKIYKARGLLYRINSYIFIIEGSIGVIFSLLVLHSSLRVFKKCRSPHLKISFAILILDFILCLVMIVMGISANVNGKYLATHTWFCGFVDIFYIGSTYISIWYVALMSLERGLLIIHKISFPLWLWIAIMISEVMIFLVLNIFSISFNQMGLAELAIYCISTPDRPTGYITIIWYFAMMCINLLIVTYSYTGIAIMQRRRAWKDIRELNMDKNDTLRRANSIIKKVLFLLFLFLACNMLEIINTVIELSTSKARSAAADFASIMMLNCNPIINCIILIQFHESIKISLIETYPILAKIFWKRSHQAQINSVLNNTSHN